jgi:hypothetical protein
MPRKYPYSSIIGSSVVVRENKPPVKNEIETIIDTDDGLLFLTGYYNKHDIIYSVNIHTEFYFGLPEKIDIEHCLTELLENHSDFEYMETNLEVSMTN